jgi:hypothetical protein
MRRLLISRGRLWYSYWRAQPQRAGCSAARCEKNCRGNLISYGVRTTSPVGNRDVQLRHYHQQEGVVLIDGADPLRRHSLIIPESREAAHFPADSVSDHLRNPPTITPRQFCFPRRGGRPRFRGRTAD